MRSALLRVGVGLSLGLAGLGGVLLVNSFAGVRPSATSLAPASNLVPTSNPAPASAPPFPRGQRSVATNDGLGASNRDQVRICVQSLSPTVSATDVQSAVAGLLPPLRAHPDYRPNRLDKKPPAVETGCPGGPLLERPDFKYNDKVGLFPSVDTYVMEASPYQLFVYVVPEERLKAAGFDVSPTRDGTQSRLLTREQQADERDHMSGVTLEYYATPGEIANSTPLVRVLKVSLMLGPIDTEDERKAVGEDKETRQSAWAVQTQVAAGRAPKWRAAVGAGPVMLRDNPTLQTAGVELSPGTLLTQTGSELVFGTTWWVPVEDTQGRRGWVRRTEVAPVP